MKKFTLKEQDLRNMIRDILSEIIGTSDLVGGGGVQTRQATTDLSPRFARSSSDDYDDTRSDSDSEGCGESYSINDLNSNAWPENASKAFRAFKADLESKGYRDIVVTSGIRTVQKQIELERSVAVAGDPGKSDHQYGYAIDINLTHPTKGRLTMNSVDGWEDVAKIAGNHNLAWEGESDRVHFKVKGIKASERWRHPRLAGCGPVGPEWACKGACNEPWKIIAGQADPPTKNS